jgi:GntR family transcriptional regulator, galactonate operon transcriptional repressor
VSTRYEKMDPFGELGCLVEQEDLRMHERLATLLAREIVSGRMPEGSAFPSGDDLTARYGVSRTVARETVQSLATSGLVLVRHGRRTVVTGSSQWRLLDLLLQRAMRDERLPDQLVRAIYEARRCIETETARLCAVRASQGLVEGLIANVDRAAECLRAPAWDSALQQEFRRLDATFHSSIGDGAANPVLACVARDAHNGLLTSWSSTARLPPR